MAHAHENMARDDKIQMPSSGAGITRYFGEFKSKFSIQPTHVIVIAIIAGILVLLLHKFGPAL